MSQLSPPPRPCCRAIGCSVRIQPHLLMCFRHWAKVPSDLKAEVFRHYVKGQEIRNDPTPEYLRAARAAIESVRQREGVES